MTADDLKREIEFAFQGVTLGSGIGLRQAQAIDDHESEAVQERKRALDEKENWRRIAVKDLNECYSSPSFFDGQGMRFHLPAFILAEIEGAANVGPLFELTHSYASSPDKLEMLSELQRQAVTSFLRWCLEQPRYEDEQEAIERALREYWDPSNSSFNADASRRST
jgi:hypothetical protein